MRVAVLVFFPPSSPKPYDFRARVAHLGRLKTHLPVGSGRMWKVVWGGASSALGILGSE